MQPSLLNSLHLRNETHDRKTPEKGKWSNYVCEYCNKIGHSDKVRRKKKKNEEITTAVASAVSNRSAGFLANPYQKSDKTQDYRDKNCFTTFIPYSHRRKCDWYADSGSMSHMSDQSEFFTFLKPIESEK